MNFSALISNLKTNPVPALGGLLIALSTAPILLNDPDLAKWAALLGAVGGILLSFSKQSTTTGGITANATAVKDTLPLTLETPSVMIVPPPPTVAK